jgi:hypothetical protein
MTPSLRKSATLAETDTWIKDRRLRLHAHVVDMVNRFCSEDKYILYADGKVYPCLYQHILSYTII